MKKKNKLVNKQLFKNNLKQHKWLDLQIIFFSLEYGTKNNNKKKKIDYNQLFKDFPPVHVFDLLEINVWRALLNWHKFVCDMKPIDEE